MVTAGIAPLWPAAGYPLLGAALALLIVAGLERANLKRLYALILDLGMTPLVETHSAEELEIAIDLGADPLTAPLDAITCDC